MQQKDLDAVKPDILPKATSFGQFICADHAIFTEGSQSRKHVTVVLIMQDSFTYWPQAYPAERKTAEECYTGFRRFMGVGKEADHCYSENGGEIHAALAKRQRLQ